MIINTEVGTAQFPWLNTPDTKYNQAGDYKVNLIISEAKARNVLDALKNEQEKLYAKTYASAKPQDKDKIARGNLFDYEFDMNGQRTGNIILKAKLKANVTMKDGKTFTQKPVLVGPDLKPYEEQIRGGEKISLACELVPYFNAATKVISVSLRLKAVQVVEKSQGQTQETPKSTYGFKSYAEIKNGEPDSDYYNVKQNATPAPKEEPIQEVEDEEDIPF